MTTARRKRNNSNMRTASDSNTFVGYESELWRMADALRGSMDAAEYKHVVLGLVFLKYISDAFEEAYAKLEAERDQGADPEDPDEYRAQSIFWVPPEARWQHLRNQARQPTIGRLVDDQPGTPGCTAQGVWQGRPRQAALGASGGPGEQHPGRRHRGASNHVLGRVYEYFLEQFALAEGRKGGEFYTPRSVVRLLVEMLEPYQGRVYDPCCGSGPTLQATVTEAGPGATSPYTARSPTTPPGVWPG